MSMFCRLPLGTEFDYAEMDRAQYMLMGAKLEGLISGLLNRVKGLEQELAAFKEVVVLKELPPDEPVMAELGALVSE